MGVVCNTLMYHVVYPIHIMYSVILGCWFSHVVTHVCCRVDASCKPCHGRYRWVFDVNDLLGHELEMSKS
jgi:hypothetical protein